VLLFSVSDVVETRCNIDALFFVDLKGEGRWDRYRFWKRRRNWEFLSWKRM